MLPREVKITGFAVPFGKPNSYNETLAPGALDAFVERVERKGAKLPMGFMHELHAGTWDKLTVKPNGLYVEGRITEPQVIAYLDKATHGTFTGELSITFRPRDIHTHPLKETHERFNSRPLWEQVHAPRDLELKDEVTTDEAVLTEISLVDRGAFKGTYFTTVEPKPF